MAESVGVGRGGALGGLLGLLGVVDLVARGCVFCGAQRVGEIGEFLNMDTETGGEKDRPRDDEIQAFHNQIRAADAERLEFVGDKVRLPFPFLGGLCLCHVGMCLRVQSLRGYCNE